MESFEFRAAFHVCSWLRECHSFDRKTTELIQLFQYTTTRSLMIFSVYVRMNNIITRKIERLRALITLAVCTRPNFRRFVPLRFCVAKIWPGTRLGVCTFINGSCKFVNPCITWNSNKECYGTDYQCTDKEHYQHRNCTFYEPPPPPPKAECLPINGTCQQYNPCRKWPGFCGGPYQCITDIQYYRYTHGPQPECPVPVPPRPNPPGECIYQHGQCVWSSKYFVLLVN